jgi:hypothetical protein
MFPATFNQCNSLSVKDEVSFPYKASGKTAVEIQGLV